jgi:hypothetical protein
MTQEFFHFPNQCLFLFHALTLFLYDNGDGMTGEEMVKFINQLSFSVSTQSMSGNYDDLDLPHLSLQQNLHHNLNL